MTDAITAPFCAYRGIKIEFVITFMIDAIAEPGRRIYSFFELYAN